MTEIRFKSEEEVPKQGKKIIRKHLPRHLQEQRNLRPLENRTFLTPDEIRMYLKYAMDNEIKSFLWLAYESGRRYTQVSALRYEDIQWDERKILMPSAKRTDTTDKKVSAKLLDKFKRYLKDHEAEKVIIKRAWINPEQGVIYVPKNPRIPPERFNANDFMRLDWGRDVVSSIANKLDERKQTEMTVWEVNVHPDESRLQYKIKRTNEYETFFASPQLIEILRIYTDEWDIKQGDVLFPSERGRKDRPVTGQTVNNWIEKIGKKILAETGIDMLHMGKKRGQSNKITIHVFGRHSRATEIGNKYGKGKITQAIVGWESLKNVQFYDHAVDEDKRSAVDNITVDNWDELTELLPARGRKSLEEKYELVAEREDEPGIIRTPSGVEVSELPTSEAEEERVRRLEEREKALAQKEKEFDERFTKLETMIMKSLEEKKKNKR